MHKKTKKENDMKGDRLLNMNILVRQALNWKIQIITQCNIFNSLSMRKLKVLIQKLIMYCKNELFCF